MDTKIFNEFDLIKDITKKVNQNKDNYQVTIYQESCLDLKNLETHQIDRYYFDYKKRQVDLERALIVELKNRAKIMHYFAVDLKTYNYIYNIWNGVNGGLKGLSKEDRDECIRREILNITDTDVATGSLYKSFIKDIQSPFIKIV